MNFEAEGILSLWIGHFAGEDDLFEYVDFRYDDDGNSSCQFALDAGLGWFDHDFQEAHYTEAGLTDAAQVLVGHSYSASFIEPAVAAITQFRRPQDNAVFILYDVAYNPLEVQPRSTARLRFVGTFAYDETAPSAAQ